MGFDLDQMAVLSPLYERCALVYFPFFANTFPLAYHYHRLIETRANTHAVDENVSRGSASGPEIRVYEWSGEVVPHEIFSDALKDRYVVFYATREAYETKKADLDKHGVFGQEFVTTYLPRIFFFHTHRQISLRKIVETAGEPSTIAFNQNETFKLTERLAVKLNQRFKEIEIYTDIPKQATLLKNQFHDLGVADVTVIDQWETYFNSKRLNSEVARVFFYGAPVTSALGQRPIEFTQMQCPDFGRSDEFDTLICAGYLGPAYDAKKVINDISDLIKCLTEYHQRLYAVASEIGEADQAGRDGDFRDIWWTYNRYAVSKQHNSYFSSPKEYANCLYRHHGTLGQDKS